MADNVEILNKESEKNRVFFRFVGQGESKKRGKQRAFCRVCFGSYA